VISKLRHAGVKEPESVAQNRDELASLLKSYFGGDLVNLRPVFEGTLSVCFLGELRGRACFFKTYSAHTRNDTLEREVMFLKATALDVANPRLLHIKNEGSERTWLQTNALEPCHDLEPTKVCDLILKYEKNLCGYSKSIDLSNSVPLNSDIHFLITEAKVAITRMIEMNLFSACVQDMAHISIDRVQKLCINRPLQLCHGDLGPSNIMCASNTAVALDWEDVFWGIPGYDYLYWLTFLCNKRWLSLGALDHALLDRKDALAVLYFIVILKSWISVRNDSYHKNTISLNQRLQELVYLD